MELSDYQKDILIRTALGEARGQGVEGMADVIQVILNRANSGQFPSDPAAVALQNKQFSTWNKGEGGNNPQQFKKSSRIYKTAAEALEAVASGVRPDPTGGALYYHTPAVSPAWSASVNRNGTIKRNGHIFYPNHPVPPGEIPSVATLLDVKREAPAPAIPSIAATQRRSVASPTGGNTALQEALNAEAARRATAIGNRVTPAVRSIAEQQQNLSASDRARGNSPMYSVTIAGRAPIGLSEPGNLDLNKRVVYNGPDGDYRTENSMSIGTDRGEALIPTVVNGRQLSEQQAIDHYMATGEFLGMFKTPQAADQYAEALHLRQEQKYAPKSTTAVRGTSTSLTAPGAVDAAVNRTRQDPTLASILASRAAAKAPISISDRVRGNPVQTRNVATTIASIPTTPIGSISDRVRGNEANTRNVTTTLASFPTGPARLPDIAPSTVGQAPTTRTVQSITVQPRTNSLTDARAEQSVQRTKPVTTLPRLTVAAPVQAPPQSIIERSPPLSISTRGTAPTWGEFSRAVGATAPGTAIPLGNMMASQAPRIDSIASSPSWADFTGSSVGKQPTRVAQPNAAPKQQDRLVSSTPLAIGVPVATARPAAVLPTAPQLAAATGFRTITQPTKTLNPAWTAYRAANPAQPTAINSPVPLGEMKYTGSRDTVAQAKAGQNFAATKMPDKWIMGTKKVQVPIVSQPAAVVRAAPVVNVAPVPVQPTITPTNPIMGILGAIAGNRAPNSILSGIIGAAAPRPAVGSNLGVSSNGGTVTQGYNGQLNSITQGSDAWKVATGQQSRSSGQSNDTRYESYF